MQKPFSNTEFSDRRCILCSDPLKKNLLAKLPSATMDFKCWYPLETKRRGGHGKGRMIKNF